MTVISYPEFPAWGTTEVSTQSLPKVIHDLADHFGIEPDHSILEKLTPIEGRVLEGVEQHKNGPAVQRRKKSELLYQANESIIAELSRRQTELEEQRLNDAESGEQNLDTLEELASLKSKLEILIEENRKLNDRVFNYSQAESHSYINMKNTIRDAVHHERCGVRSELLEKITLHMRETSSDLAQFIAMDAHTDFTKIETEVKRGLNL